MTTFGFLKFNRNFIFALSIILVLFGFSVSLRLSNHSRGMNYTNYDATWHVLLTMRGMSQNDYSAYLTLPLVTLGDAENRFYPWGSTIGSIEGIYL